MPLARASFHAECDAEPVAGGHGYSTATGAREAAGPYDRDRAGIEQRAARGALDLRVTLQPPALIDARANLGHPFLARAARRWRIVVLGVRELVLPDQHEGREGNCRA